MIHLCIPVGNAKERVGNNQPPTFLTTARKDTRKLQNSQRKLLVDICDSTLDW